MTVKRVAVVIGVNLVILVVIVVVLELGFGAWVRRDALNRLNLVRDKRLQFSTMHLYRSNRGVAIYTRDKYGLRSDCGAPSKITLLTVGGSTTDQRYISDDATWQAVMQRDLTRRGVPVCVGNAGVDGQSTIGHLKDFEWWFPNVPGLKPNQILFFVGINDFYTQKQAEHDELTYRPEDKSIRQRLQENSAIYHAAYTLYGNYQALIKFEAGHGGINMSALAWTTNPLRDDHHALMESNLRAYRNRLSLLVRRTATIGAIPIFVTQPSRWHRVRDGVVEGVAATTEFEGVKINGVDRHIMMRLLDAVTCEVASINKVPCIDLGGTDSWESGDFYDFAHMTPSGAGKVGRLLADALEPIV